MNERLIDAAHDGREDCGYNVGRECDCSQAADNADRILAVARDLADEAVTEYLHERDSLGYLNGDVMKGAIAARNRILRALS